MCNLVDTGKVGTVVLKATQPKTDEELWDWGSAMTRQHREMRGAKRVLMCMKSLEKRHAVNEWTFDGPFDEDTKFKRFVLGTL